LTLPDATIGHARWSHLPRPMESPSMLDESIFMPDETIFMLHESIFMPDRIISMPDEIISMPDRIIFMLDEIILPARRNHFTCSTKSFECIQNESNQHTTSN
jgi:hypothetical protein